MKLSALSDQLSATARWRRAAEPQQIRLVGAGLACPRNSSMVRKEGQGKPSPYETCKFLLRKIKITVLQSGGPLADR